MRPAVAGVHEPHPPARPQDRAPVVILGVARRSGTNYLARLLASHPDCAQPGDPLREDHLLADARLLLRYARSTSHRWPRRWGDRQSARDELVGHLGAGLVGFLRDRAPAGRVVTKTPSTRNLHLAERLLPAASVVLLVRDGRAVTASMVRGFGFTHERAMVEWRAGARRILAGRGRPGDRTIFVRYEMVVSDPEHEVPRILRELGLDPAGIDPAAVHRLPVTGSSFLPGDDGALNWAPRDRPPDFDPAGRGTGWSTHQRARFAWVAGREQRALGYPLDAPTGVWWTGMNLLMDAVRPFVIAVDLARERLRTLRAGHRRRRGQPGDED